MPFARRLKHPTKKRKRSGERTYQLFPTQTELRIKEDIDYSRKLLETRLVQKG
jgi:hypothetical protein